MAGKKGKRDNDDYRPRKKDANLSEKEVDDFVDGEDLIHVTFSEQSANIFHGAVSANVLLATSDSHTIMAIL
jgi:hypothetical protein